MKDVLRTIPGVLLVVVFLMPSVQGQMATWDEALTVAENWTVRVIQNKGNWGSSDWAQVVDIREFKRGERIIGYFCKVEPTGFIVVSLRKELAPIKAYSTESDLDPESDEGMADLLKMKMEGILDAIEEPIRLYGVDAVPYVQVLLEIDYRPAWDQLCGQAQVFSENLQSDPHPMNYQEGRVLLTSSWHQGPPYNSFCPVGDTTCILGRDRTVVGCVATAAAQIMKYWNWPPSGIGSHQYFWDGDDSCKEGGTPGAGAQWLSATFSDDYDWLNMPDRLTADSAQAKIEAVAELCYELGVAIEMDYGVKGSGIHFDGLNMVRNSYIETFHFSSELGWLQRFIPGRNPESISPEQWFAFIKMQIDSNWPIQYFIPGHSVVVDGWQEDFAGKKYHMNYGWDDWVDPYDPNWSGIKNSNTWYTLDALPGSSPKAEFLLGNIYPAQALGALLAGNSTYPKESFNCRYFDHDVTGTNVSFAAGQNLQFLPGVSVACIGGYIRFEGASFDNTRLFSIKSMNKAEIKIGNGGLKLYPGGSIRFYQN